MSPDPTKERGWSKENKLLLAQLFVGVLTLVAAALVVREVRISLKLPTNDTPPMGEERPSQETQQRSSESPGSAVKAGPETEARGPHSAQLISVTLGTRFDTVRSLNESLRKCWSGIAANYPAGVTLHSDIQNALSGSQAALQQGEQTRMRRDANGLTVVVNNLEKYNQTLRQHQIGSRDTCP